jgi:hypothetical protein
MKDPKTKPFSLPSKPFSPKMMSIMRKATHATMIFKMHRLTMKQTKTYVVFFHGWSFKKVCCGFLGAHFSLLN